jgi:uncharacterized membrane protein (DUF373 family)
VTPSEAAINKARFKEQGSPSQEKSFSRMDPSSIDHTRQSDLGDLFVNATQSRLFNRMTRYLVSGLILCLGLWIAGGIYQLLHQFVLAFETDWSHLAEKMIIDAVILLAVLELIRTLQSYLALGRVKVTLILDAALVVLIGELISLWYREYTTREVMLSLTVIVILTLLRIITVKFSPEIPGDRLDNPTDSGAHEE